MYKNYDDLLLMLSVHDVAEVLGISKSNVTVTLMRTRLKLRNYLEKEGFL